MQEIYFTTLSQKQIQHEKMMLHKSIHRLLFCKEQNDQNLQKYFEILLCRIGGLNNLLNQPTEIMDLLVMIQSAKNESEKDNCNFTIYRKMILDAHTVVDSIHI